MEPATGRADTAKSADRGSENSETVIGAGPGSSGRAKLQSWIEQRGDLRNRPRFQDSRHRRNQSALSILLSGERQSKSWNQEAATFDLFDLKGILKTALSQGVDIRDENSRPVLLRSCVE